MIYVEYEFHHLTTRNTSTTTYTKLFKDLATICPKLICLEITKIETYIKGLAHEIK